MENTIIREIAVVEAIKINCAWTNADKTFVEQIRPDGFDGKNRSQFITEMLQKTM